MNINTLVIVDLDKDINFERINCDYINLSTGSIHLKNSREIFIKNLIKKKYKYYKNKLVLKLIEKIKSQKNNNFFFSEFELFNIRNDKESNFNRIINILILKDYLLNKSYTKVEIITNQIITYNAFHKINKNINSIFFGEKESFLKYNLLKILKFYFKTFFIVLYLKFFDEPKSINKSYEDLGISLYPNFFKKKKEFFFKNEKFLIANFLLTDETHNGHSFFKIIKIIKFLKEKKNLIHVEKLISIKDLFLSFLKIIFYDFVVKAHVKKKFVIENIDFTYFYKNYIFASYINRSKLEIYNKALIKIIKKFSIKKFHLYMFEYCLGFHLIRLVKTSCKKVKIIGYQHGIFSDNLMWFDVVSKLNIKKYYLVNEIVTFNAICKKNYIQKFQNNKILYKIRSKEFSEIVNSYRSMKNKKKITKYLVLPGTHDIKDFYYGAKKYLSLNRKDVKFYFKVHPKAKFFFKSNSNIKIVKKLNKNKFNNVIISPTSTLVYDFYFKKFCFLIANFGYKKNIAPSFFLKNKKNIFHFTR